MTSRRTFLSGTLALLGGGASAAPAAGAPASPPAAASLRHTADGHTPRWAMVMDLRKCIGCQACTVACAMENNVPEGNHRTHVPVYEVETGHGPVPAMLPRMCNHCEEPPCVPVCPVEATFQTEDGIVLVDHDACVGCGYCVQACPYEAGFINHDTGAAGKCTFCIQRLEAGLLAACVETCVGGARVLGDLRDPDSTVSRLLAEHDTRGLKPEAGTRPQVHYIGLDDRLVSEVEIEQGARAPRRAPYPHTPTRRPEPCPESTLFPSTQELAWRPWAVAYFLIIGAAVGAAFVALALRGRGGADAARPALRVAARPGAVGAGAVAGRPAPAGAVPEPLPRHRARIGDVVGGVAAAAVRGLDADRGADRCRRAVAGARPPGAPGHAGFRCGGAGLHRGRDRDRGRAAAVAQCRLSGGPDPDRAIGGGGRGAAGNSARHRDVARSAPGTGGCRRGPRWW